LDDNALRKAYPVRRGTALAKRRNLFDMAKLKGEHLAERAGCKKELPPCTEQLLCKPMPISSRA
ncbi:MAG: hypothetical protein IKW66_00225, partial [Clostridia bacterium]|nr:hypothetical protein [Clostridia bacterium]